jgi:SPP1 family predicted phage head-tail adaptor
MKPPRLNHSLVLEAPLRIADGAGGFINDWQSLGVLWAELKARSGREVAASATAVSRMPYRITVRAAPYGAPSRPAPGQRFRDGDRVFQINAVAEKDANAQFLVCFAEEEVAS